MVDRALRRKLLAELGISRQALSQRAKRLKEKYGPMTTDEAVYIIAHMEGLDISKSLPLAALDRVRSLVPREAVPAQPPRSHRPRRSRSTPTYPLVSQATIATAATLGSDEFPLLFVLENSIREFIRTRLSTGGSTWWQSTAPAEVQRNVSRTMTREQRYPYRERRGSHPLYYANFADLKIIILANPNAFRDVIHDLDWFRVKMDEVYMARNNLAHCVPLSSDDATRIALFHRDWARLLTAAGV